MYLAFQSMAATYSVVYGALSTTELNLEKLKRIYSDLCWLKNERIFSVIKLKVKFG